MKSLKHFSLMLMSIFSVGFGYSQMVQTDYFDYYEDMSTHSYLDSGVVSSGAYVCSGNQTLRLGNCTSTGGSFAEIIVDVFPGTPTVDLEFQIGWYNGTNELYVDSVLIPTSLAGACATPQTVNLTGMNSYTLDGQLRIRVVEGPGGCAGDIQLAELTVFAMSCPATDLIVGNTTICETDSLILDAGPDMDTYLWNDLSANQTLTISTAGTYYVETVDSNSCIFTDTMELAHHVSPTVDLGSDITTCDASVTLDAGSGYSSYFWTGGGTGQTLIVNTSGIFDVTVSDGNGCSAQDSVTVTLLDCSGISTNDLAISIYPNPSSGIFMLSSGSNIDRLEVLTADGKLVLSQLTPGSGPQQIQLEESGTYFIRLLKDNSVVITKKVVVSR